MPTFTLAQANKGPSEFPLPAIVKPAAEDASVGIDNSAVCTSKRALKRRVAQMLEQFEEVVIQEYVAGREFNVGFVGKRMLPIAEIRFDDLPDGTWPIVSYAAKWIPGSPEDEGTIPVCPAELPTRSCISGSPRWPATAWEHMADGEGYGRVDMRLNEDGQPYVLEVNPTPTSRAMRAWPGWAAPSAGATTTWSCRSLMRHSLARRAIGPPRPWSAGCPPRERHHRLPTSSRSHSQPTGTASRRSPGR